MKFCGNCGKELADDEMFCPDCGMQSESEVVNEQSEAVVDEQIVANDVPEVESAPLSDGNDDVKDGKKKTKTIIAAVVAVVVLILAVFGIASCSSTNSSPKNVVKKMEKVFNLKGVSVNDVIKICDPIVAKELKEEIKDDKDIKDDFKDNLKEAREEIEDEYGKNAKIKLKIKSEKNIKKSDSTYEYIEEYFEDEDLKLQAAKNIKVEMSVKGSDGNDEDVTTFTVVKVKGKWYLYGSTFSYLFN